jgi:hypothetical protein
VQKQVPGNEAQRQVPMHIRLRLRSRGEIRLAYWHKSVVTIDHCVAARTASLVGVLAAGSVKQLHQRYRRSLMKHHPGTRLV